MLHAARLAAARTMARRAAGARPVSAVAAAAAAAAGPPRPLPPPPTEGAPPAPEELLSLLHQIPGTHAFGAFRYDAASDTPYPIWALDPHGPLYAAVLHVARGASEVLTAFHDGSGLPWWAAIVAAGALVRAALLPLTLYSMRNAARAVDAKEDIAALLRGFRAARSRLGPAAGVLQMVPLYRAMRQGLAAAMERARFYPLRSLAVPLVSVPFVAGGVLGARHAVLMGDASFEAEGALWFPDLTVPDPLYVLPLLALAVSYGATELIFSRGQAGRKSSGGVYLLGAGLGDRVKSGLQMLLIAGSPLMVDLPAGLFVLMTANGVWTLAQVSTLRHPAVYRAVTGRELPTLGESAPHTPPELLLRTAPSPAGGDAPGGSGSGDGGSSDGGSGAGGAEPVRLHQLQSGGGSAPSALAAAGASAGAGSDGSRRPGARDSASVGAARSPALAAGLLHGASPAAPRRWFAGLFSASGAPPPVAATPLAPPAASSAAPAGDAARHSGAPRSRSAAPPSARPASASAAAAPAAAPYEDWLNQLPRLGVTSVAEASSAHVTARATDGGDVRDLAALMAELEPQLEGSLRSMDVVWPMLLGHPNPFVLRVAGGDPRSKLMKMGAPSDAPAPSVAAAAAPAAPLAAPVSGMPAASHAQHASRSAATMELRSPAPMGAAHVPSASSPRSSASPLGNAEPVSVRIIPRVSLPPNDSTGLAAAPPAHSQPASTTPMLHDPAATSASPATATQQQQQQTQLMRSAAIRWNQGSVLPTYPLVNHPLGQPRVFAGSIATTVYGLTPFLPRGSPVYPPEGVARHDVLEMPPRSLAWRYSVRRGERWHAMLRAARCTDPTGSLAHTVRLASWPPPGVAASAAASSSSGSGSGRGLGGGGGAGAGGGGSGDDGDGSSSRKPPPGVLPVGSNAAAAVAPEGPGASDATAVAGGGSDSEVDVAATSSSDSEGAVGMVDSDAPPLRSGTGQHAARSASTLSLSSGGSSGYATGSGADSSTPSVTSSASESDEASAAVAGPSTGVSLSDPQSRAAGHEGRELQAVDEQLQLEPFRARSPMRRASRITRTRSALQSRTLPSAAVDATADDASPAQGAHESQQHGIVEETEARGWGVEVKPLPEASRRSVRRWTRIMRVRAGGKSEPDAHHAGGAAPTPAGSTAGDVSGGADRLVSRVIREHGWPAKQPRSHSARAGTRTPPVTSKQLLGYELSDELNRIAFGDERPESVLERMRRARSVGGLLPAAGEAPAAALPAKEAAAVLPAQPSPEAPVGEVHSVSSAAQAPEAAQPPVDAGPLVTDEALQLLLGEHYDAFAASTGRGPAQAVAGPPSSAAPAAASTTAPATSVDASLAALLASEGVELVSEDTAAGVTVLRLPGNETGAIRLALRLRELSRRASGSPAHTGAAHDELEASAAGACESIAINGRTIVVEFKPTPAVAPSPGGNGGAPVDAAAGVEHSSASAAAAAVVAAAVAAAAGSPPALDALVSTSPPPARLAASPAALARTERLRSVAIALALLESPEYHALQPSGLTLPQAMAVGGALEGDGGVVADLMDLGHGRMIGHGVAVVAAANHPDPAAAAEAAANEPAAGGGGSGGSGEPPAAWEPPSRYEAMRRVSQLFQDPRKAGAAGAPVGGNRRSASGNPHLQNLLTFARAQAILQAGSFTVLSRVGVAPASLPFAVVEPGGEPTPAARSQADVEDFLQRIAHAVSAGGTSALDADAMKRLAAVFDGDPEAPIPVYEQPPSAQQQQQQEQPAPSVDELEASGGEGENDSDSGKDQK